MINSNNIPSFSKTLSLLVLLVILLVLLFSGVFIAVALLSIAIVPLTWIWGLLTGQSYDRVCDNSEIIYKLNQFGKWSFAIGIAIGLVALIALVRNLRTILKHRSSWPTERADTNEIYKSFGRWYLSIPSSIKARQWSGLVFAPWHVNVEDHHPE